jgi:hypothetical protein
MRPSRSCSCRSPVSPACCRTRSPTPARCARSTQSATERSSRRSTVSRAPARRRRAAQAGPGQTAPSLAGTWRLPAAATLTSPQPLPHNPAPSQASSPQASATPRTSPLSISPGTPSAVGACTRAGAGLRACLACLTCLACTVARAPRAANPTQWSHKCTPPPCLTPPGSIPALPQTLRMFNVSSNSLTALPSVLPSSLKVLDASFNSLGGTIPPLNFNLIHLNLQDNELEGALPAFLPRDNAAPTNNITAGRKLLWKQKITIDAMEVRRLRVARARSPGGGVEGALCTAPRGSPTLPAPAAARAPPGSTPFSVATPTLPRPRPPLHTPRHSAPRPTRTPPPRRRCRLTTSRSCALRCCRSTT